MPIERKLAAIMFTDIAGYTEQISKHEAVAISLINKKESVLKPLIAKHNGTYVKSTGDGSLPHFNSAVDAATCAKKLQESIYDDKYLNVRVGLHLGNTMVFYVCANRICIFFIFRNSITISLIEL